MHAPDVGNVSNGDEKEGQRARPPFTADTVGKEMLAGSATGTASHPVAQASGQAAATPGPVQHRPVRLPRLRAAMRRGGQVGATDTSGTSGMMGTAADPSVLSAGDTLPAPTQRDGEVHGCPAPDRRDEQAQTATDPGMDPDAPSPRSVAAVPGADDRARGSQPKTVSRLPVLGVRVGMPQLPQVFESPAAPAVLPRQSRDAYRSNVAAGTARGPRSRASGAAADRAELSSRQEARAETGTGLVSVRARRRSIARTAAAAVWPRGAVTRAIERRRALRRPAGAPRWTPLALVLVTSVILLGCVGLGALSRPWTDALLGQLLGAAAAPTGVAATAWPDPPTVAVTATATLVPTLTPLPLPPVIEVPKDWCTATQAPPACLRCPWTYQSIPEPTHAEARAALDAAADAYGLPHQLTELTAWTETRAWSQNWLSCSYDFGIMQIKDGQAVGDEYLRVSACGVFETTYDFRDVRGNALLGAKLIKYNSCFWLFDGGQGGTAEQPAPYTLAWRYAQAGRSLPDTDRSDSLCAARYRHIRGSPSSDPVATYHFAAAAEYTALFPAGPSMWSCPLDPLHAASSPSLLDATVLTYNRGVGETSGATASDPGARTRPAGVNLAHPQYLAYTYQFVAGLFVTHTLGTPDDARPVDPPAA